MSDAEAHEFYKDPEHLAIAGQGRRRERPMKTAMIPIRFTQEMIAAVKRFASQDGVTVSTWIRGVLAKEIQRRQPSVTTPTGTAEDVHLDYPPKFRPQSETVGSSTPELCIS